MIKNQLKISSKLFYKYLLSCIILLLVPTIIFFGIIQNTFIKIFENEILDKNKSMLIQVKDTIDTRIEQLWSVSMHISESSELSQFKEPATYSKKKGIINILKNNSYMYSDIYEILLI